VHDLIKANILKAILSIKQQMSPSLSFTKIAMIKTGTLVATIQADFNEKD